MLEQNNNTDPASPDVICEYRFAGFRVDIRQKILFAQNDEALTLSSRAFDTLLFLLQNHGETVSKALLMKQVWANVIVEENNLNQAISCLRKALGDNRNESRMIMTVPGRGYCFVAEVEALPQCSPRLQARDTDTEAPERSAPASRQAGRIFSYSWQTLVTAMLLLVTLSAVSVYHYASSSFPGNGAAINPVPAAVTDEGNGVAGKIIKNSIAVLPFSNLNPGSDNDLFALGLHDEVINQLSKIQSLNVIARNSVLALVEQKPGINELARLLHVESLMSGTILFAGDQARISLQMLDANTGVTLWTQTYEAGKQDLAEMISIQSDIAKHVAHALETEIQLSEQEKIAAIPTTSFEAYRYNLAARIAYFNLDFLQTWELAKQAIEHDSRYYDAYYTFSAVNTVLVATPLPGMSSLEHYELALQSAEKMIRLAPDNPESYALKAVALSTNKDWDGFAAMMEQLEAMQAPASSLQYISLVLMCMGEFDKAIAIYEANLVTEPLNLFGRGFLMEALELAGRREQSRREYQLGEELTRTWWGDTVDIFLALGRNEPLQDIDELVGISPELKQLLSHAYDRNLVREGLEAYRSSGRRHSAESTYYAALAAHNGDNELAVELMRAALKDVWIALHWLWLPVFDEARKLESFRTLLRDSDIVAYWQKHGWPEVCQPTAESFSCDWTAYPD